MVHTIAVHQHSRFNKDICLMVTQALDVEVCDFESVQDWVNEARIGTITGNMLSDEVLRESLKATAQSSFHLGENWEVVLHQMGYSESFEGETLYVFVKMMGWTAHIIRQQVEWTPTYSINVATPNPKYT